jgi:hypothetical protein
MKTVQEFNNFQELRNYLEDLIKTHKGEVTIKPYGYDERIDWDTFIVCVDGDAVGFCDQGECIQI